MTDLGRGLNYRKKGLQRAWRHARSLHVIFLGSNGETAGNQFCLLLPAENGQRRMLGFECGPKARRIDQIAQLGTHGRVLARTTSLPKKIGAMIGPISFLKGKKMKSVFEPNVDPEIIEMTRRYDDMLKMDGIDLHEFRAMCRAIVAEQGMPVPPVETRHIHVPTRHGPVLTRLYYPSPDRSRPLIVYMHGGGFMVGDLDCVDIALHRISREADVAILSIEYGLAPERRYPVALEQCQDVLVWCTANRDAISKANKIGIAGDSAGGNLAALLAIWSRDVAKIDIAWQCMINPVLNFPGIETATTGSLVTYANGPVLHTAIMKHFMNQYFSNQEERIEASPALCTNLSSLPPAFIAVGEFDPLRDECIAYGDQLTSAGTTAVVKVYERMVHNFIGMVHLSKTASRFVDELVESAKLSLHSSQ